MEHSWSSSYNIRNRNLKIQKVGQANMPERKKTMKAGKIIQELQNKYVIYSNKIFTIAIKVWIVFLTVNVD